MHHASSAVRVLFLLAVPVAAAGAQQGVEASSFPPRANAAPAVVATGVVRGIVVDAQGAPVPSALVRLTELHRAEQSHEDGTFLLRDVPEGRWTLVVQRLGYRPDTRRIEVAGSDTLQLRVQLATAVLRLAPTVVTGQLSEREGRDALSPVGVLAGAALDRNVEGTVGGSLRGEPGVAVGSTGPATARPVIRGLGADRILVLEDGQRPGDLSSTSGDHAVAIEPLTARQIEVVRGPMSLMYGPSALGGVVNVVRDEVPTALPEHLHGALSLQGTSVNRGLTAGGVATFRAGRLGLRAEGTARGNGDLRTPSGILGNTQAATYSAALGAALVGEIGHVGMSYRFFDNAYGIPGGFIGSHPGGVDITMRRHTLRGEAEAHREGKAFPVLKATAIATDYGHEERERNGAIGTLFEQRTAATDLLARHGGAGIFALGAFGARAQFRDVGTGGSLATPDTRDWSVAGFVVEELGRGPVRMQLGGRYDWARYVPQDTGSVFAGGRTEPIRPREFASASGSAALLWDARPDFRIGTSVGRAFRVPDFNELYSNGPHLAAYSFDVGDPSIRQETGLGVDVFARLTRERVRGEVAAFRNAMRDYIAPTSRGRAERGPSAGRPRFQYENNDALFTGAEGSLEAHVVKSLVLEGTLSYVRARFTEARDSIPQFVLTPTGEDTTFVAASEYPSFVPPLGGQLNLRWEQPRWFAGAGARFAGRQERTGDFEEPTAGYAVANVVAGLRLPIGSRLHLVTLRVDNLLDQEYRDHLSRTKVVMPEAGRNVSLLYRLEF